jgi:hypothetical protein
VGQKILCKFFLRVVHKLAPFDRLRASEKRGEGQSNPVRAEPFDSAQDRLVEA